MGTILVTCAHFSKILFHTQDEIVACKTGTRIIVLIHSVVRWILKKSKTLLMQRITLYKSLSLLWAIMLLLFPCQADKRISFVLQFLSYYCTVVFFLFIYLFFQLNCTLCGWLQNCAFVLHRNLTSRLLCVAKITYGTLQKVISRELKWL